MLCTMNVEHTVSSPCRTRAAAFARATPDVRFTAPLRRHERRKVSTSQPSVRLDGESPCRRCTLIDRIARHRTGDSTGCKRASASSSIGQSNVSCISSEGVLRLSRPDCKHCSCQLAAVFSHEVEHRPSVHSTQGSERRELRSDPSSAERPVATCSPSRPKRRPGDLAHLSPSSRLRRSASKRRLTYTNVCPHRSRRTSEREYPQRESNPRSAVKGWRANRYTMGAGDG